MNSRDIKMRHTCVTILLATLVCGATSCKHPLHEDGPHACTRTESFQTVYQEPVYESYTEVTREGPCWLPFYWGCRTVTRTLYKIRYQSGLRTDYRTTRGCCDGYTYNPDDGACIEPTTCGEEFVASHQEQTISSPCFPNNYQNNEHCVVRITSPPETLIEVKFTTFDLEGSRNCLKDFLTITDSDGELLPPSCSTSFDWPAYTHRIVSVRNSLELTFKSDSYTTASGFEATYRTVNRHDLDIFVASGEDEVAIFHRNNVVTRHIKVYRDMEKPIAVDYDPISQAIYYSDAGKKHIGKVPLTRPEEASVVVSKDIDHPTGLRVDVQSRLLYWTDEKLGTLSVSNMDGKYRTTILHGLSKPGGIVVDPSVGRMFYAVSNDSWMIESAEGDGSNRKVIVNNGVASPRALALDTTDRRLYWVNERFQIQSAGYNDEDKRTIYTLSNNENVLSLVLDSEAFFFTHNHTSGGSLSSLDRRLTAERRWSMPDRGLYKDMTLRPYKQTGSGSNPCAGLECNGMCLPRPAGVPNRCIEQEESISCGMDLVASPSPKNISSPNFPANYQHGLHCTINITSPLGTVVELEFSAFDLEDSKNCSKDYLEITDMNGTLLYPSCSSIFTWPPSTRRLISTGDSLTMTFVSDGNVSASGFKATYRSVSPNPDIFIAAMENDLLMFHRHNAWSRRIDVPLLQEPTAVDYDPRLQNIYYSDRGAKHIAKISTFNLDEAVVILSTNIENPVGLCVDESSHLLYWTDADLGTVSVSDLDGNHQKTIIQDLDSPGDIVVASYLGYIYYIVYETSPRIERAEGDGSNQTIIVSEDIVSPRSLAFDQEGNILYWIDDAMGTLHRINYDGTNQSTIFTLAIHQDVSSLVLDSESFIFTHTDGNTTGGFIGLVDRELTDERRWPMPDRGICKGLTLRPSLGTGSRTNSTCPNTACGGLCLPRPSGMYTCVEHEVSDDGCALLIWVIVVSLMSVVAIVAGIGWYRKRDNAQDSNFKYTRLVD